MRGELVALCATLVLAAGLRLHGLDQWPLELDEVYTYLRSFDLGRFNARPLYFLIQRAFLELLPHDGFYLRLPALVFGLAGVWATWALGRTAFGARAGLVAAFLAAVSPWHLYASQFARYWSLVYLLAAGVCTLLLRAVDTGRKGAYLGALALVLLGMLSHPTFALPLVGFVLGLYLVDRSGAVKWPWPPRRAWYLLWGPLLALGLVGFAALAVAGHLGALRNGDSRGSLATLRLVPAMAQWAGPVIMAAAVAAGVGLFAARPADRRWATAALLGAASCVGLLLLASLMTAVYSDYGLSMMPLAFVTIGGGLQRVGEALPKRDARVFSVAAVAVLAAGVLPGVVSHLSDGTRHDVRPAYDYLRAEFARGRRAPVYAPSRDLHAVYAPGLPYKRIGTDSTRLAEAVRTTGGFWLVGFYRRDGMVMASEAVEAWTRAHCHSVLQTQRPRLDYRIYRVELHWCGHAAAAASGTPR
ncbi:MAG TPA: glycosyltransferase family 39 protein [Longimicrobiales bacterium]